MCKYLNEQFIGDLDNDLIYEKLFHIYSLIEGSFSILFLIKDYGMVVMRDKRGIRPLSCKTKQGDYYFSSEDGVLNSIDNDYIRDVNAGEIIILKKQGNTVDLESKQYKDNLLTPCLFEYLYFANNDSCIDGISIYNARYEIGKLLAKKVKSFDIDFIVPVPESGRIFAYGLE